MERAERSGPLSARCPHGLVTLPTWGAGRFAIVAVCAAGHAGTPDELQAIRGCEPFRSAPDELHFAACENVPVR